MTSQLKAKLLQHFAGKKANGGFTLIELLVVIIIIGILSAIALPSFLNQANKARQSEARTYVGSMNRAQQAYYLENNEFADRIDILGLGISNDTETYDYRVDSTAGVEAGVSNIADPDGTNAASVKAYVGGVKIGSVPGSNEATTLAVLCEAAGAPVNSGADDATVLINAAALQASDRGLDCTSDAAGTFKGIN
ncbi:MAG: type IV pilin-like G/H family protein [Cyanobacteria bacterium J06634_5]